MKPVMYKLLYKHKSKREHWKVCGLSVDGERVKGATTPDRKIVEVVQEKMSKEFPDITYAILEIKP